MSRITKEEIEKTKCGRFLLSDENIYLSIYSLNSYVFEYNLLNTEDRILYHRLQDKFDARLINGVITRVREQIIELFDKDKYIEAKVYFKPKKLSENGELEFRPLHSTGLITQIAIVSMLHLFVYEIPEEEEGDPKLRLSNLSRLIPSDFYGNRVSVKPEYLFKPWKQQYQKYNQNSNDASFVYTQGAEKLLETSLCHMKDEFTLEILSKIPFSLQLLDVINQVIDDDIAYWEKGAMPYGCCEDEAEELKIIVEKLIACKRYVTAVNIIGHSECEAVINAECIYKLMKLAGTEESIGGETLDDYAVQKIIGWFQQQEDIDLELRSDIEFIYLPMLDEYSEVRPRALNTRLSLEPEYFCSLIELFYKKRNGEKREIELNKSLSDRLCEILFQFKVTPGIDWNGNFDAKRFDYWMKTVKTWSRDNDRYEAAMHTVGLGLSYAELDEDKLPQTAVIEELNRVENDELRRGYYLGTINQRGAHWVDPEGKPELELAEDYENRANIAESRGYSRYAGILRVIADEFKREAKSNILEAKNGDDE